MKIIKPSATLMEHNVSPYRFIERVGRTCYKSEDKITMDSAENFVAGLVKRNHWAMLEHETIYLEVSDDFMIDFITDTKDNLDDLKFFNFTMEKDANIISGSFRSFHDLFEKVCDSTPIEFIKASLHLLFPTVFGYNVRKDIKYKSFIVHTREDFVNKYNDCSGILFKHLTHTFKVVCDRGVSHEFVRHRPCSFAQESTRYCNYSLDKFGDEITFIEPCFWKGENSAYPHEEWKEQCESAEKSYFRLLDLGATPQEARAVLPNSLKTELIITATEEEWQHIVNLRYIGTTGAPHPQMKEIMSLAIKDLVEESCGRIVS